MKLIARLSLIALALTFVAMPAHAAGTLEPLGVFADAVGDGPVGAGDAYQDLVGGTIAEDDTTLTFTWIVDDIPDALTNGVPVAAYYWEFSLDDGISRGRFSLRVNSGPNPNNKPTGSLAGEPCTTTGTLISCTGKAAQIGIAVDPSADTISATVRRKDLKDENRRVLANEGAILEQESLFQGIGAYTAVPNGAFTPGATGDLAAMDDVYILGTPR